MDIVFQLTHFSRFSVSKTFHGFIMTLSPCPRTDQPYKTFSKGREKDFLLWPTEVAVIAALLSSRGHSVSWREKWQSLGWFYFINYKNIWSNKRGLFPDRALIKLCSETCDLIILIWASWLSGFVTQQEDGLLTTQVFIVQMSVIWSI